MYRADASYFEGVDQDFDALGLVEFSKPDSFVNLTWAGLYSVLLRTRSLTPELLQSRDVDGSDMRTDVGERAFALMSRGASNGVAVRFGPSEHMVGCFKTERKLLQNIAPSSVAADYYKSPIIITGNDEPIGIIKGKGEKSCYGLVDDFAHGLIRACFSQPTPYEDLGMVAEMLPRSSHAWLLPIEQAGQFAPLRFGAYAVDDRQRGGLAGGETLNWAKLVLLSSHDGIARQAEKMKKTAVPLEYGLTPLLEAA